MNCTLRKLGDPGEAVRRTDRTMIRTAAHIPFATPEYTAGMPHVHGKTTEHVWITTWGLPDFLIYDYKNVKKLSEL